MAELLAPAGNMQAFLAALQAGADAVYLGLKSFGARAGAGNFSVKELQEVRRLSSLHDVKIYITLNTLVKQREIAELIEVLQDLASIGPDAVIVQDLGVASLVKQILPNVDLHASTQMGIQSAAGARYLQSLGFTRVVLARECSLETIKEVCDTGIEVEVFVHGALCVAMSGQCLLSSLHGGRSGNRGRCAQPCRQKLDFQNKKATWLSTRDIMLYNELPALLDAGVYSLKIEGRLKSPSYVAHLCTQYRKGIEAYEAGRFQNLSRAEYIDLLQSFNRGDFSHGYAGGSEDAGIINHERSNNQGVFIGKVKRIAKTLVYIELTEDLQNGDMLRIVKGRQEEDFELIYSGPNAKAGKIATSFLRKTEGIVSGLPVYRLISEKQADFVRNLPAKQKKVYIKLKLLAGEAAEIEIACDGFRYSQRGEICESATKAPLVKERIAEVFQKTGDSGLVVELVEIESNGVFLPISKLNAFRREAIEGFLNAYLLQKSKAGQAKQWKAEPPEYQNTKRTIILSKDARLGDFAEEKYIFIYAPMDTRLEILKEELSKVKKSAYVLLNTSLSEHSAQAIIELCKENGLKGLVLDNVAQLGLDFKGLSIAFAEHIPILNQPALALLAAYKPDFIFAFPENTAIESAELGVNLSLKYYGRERVMILNHCPARTALGLTKNKEHCRMCHEADPKALMGKEFIDRKNYHFPLYPIFTDKSCIVEMYNAEPTNLSQYPDLLEKQSCVIAFTTESLEEQKEILKVLLAKKTLTGGTLGHYKEGVI